MVTAGLMWHPEMPEYIGEGEQHEAERESRGDDPGGETEPRGAEPERQGSDADPEIDQEARSE